MTTQQHAAEISVMAVEILFSTGDPFKGKVDRDSLVKEIERATLKKLVEYDTDILTEEEFQACVEAAKNEPCHV